MKHTMYSLVLIAAVVGLFQTAHAESIVAGDQVENFALVNYDGVTHTLDQYHDSTATVVMFIATQCPVSNAYNERMAALATGYQSKGFQFIGINSNKQESVDEITEHAGENSLPFPILKDHKNVIADRFGATRTPEIYVLSQENIVLYHGRIDDSQNPTRIEAHDLRAALDAISAGATINPNETRSFGCSIKRVN
jgi:peroxiredoxin